jgi:citrate synthase
VRESPTTDLHPGLEGIAFTETKLGFVDGQRGRFVYAGHDAVELAQTRSFEEVWFLLHEGRLPSAVDLAGFRALLEERGRLTDAERQAVRGAIGGVPMASLRSALSVLAASRRLQPWWNRPIDDFAREAHGLAAAMPALVEIVLHGDLGSQPDPGASYAYRYLAGVLGRQPEERLVRAVETYLILTADHGMNASTFAARVATSTGADAGAAAVAGVATLSGPLHGGAPGPVLDMLDAIGQPDRADGWIAAELAAGHRLMGFGHRVYRVEDPRAHALKQVAMQLGGPRVALAEVVERVALRALAERKPSRPLRTNVEFWTAVVLEACGIPRQAFSLTFATSRMVGWTAHMVEQAAANRLIRPTAVYIGPPPDGNP